MKGLQLILILLVFGIYLFELHRDFAGWYLIIVFAIWACDGFDWAFEDKKKEQGEEREIKE